MGRIGDQELDVEINDTSNYYIILVFVQMVGSTPGEGPTALSEFPLPLDSVSKLLEGQATVETLGEVKQPPISPS